MNHAAALDANDPDIGWILNARSACQIGSGVRAPVAGVGNYQGFVIVQNYTSKAAMVMARK